MQRALASRQGHHSHHQAADSIEADHSSGPSNSEQEELIASLEDALSCLWIITPLAATISTSFVVIAMMTNQWLHTEEKMHNPLYNGTGDKDYLSKMTVSGLWMFCYTNVGETSYECMKIDYFTMEEYSPDPNDSTMAIPYAVTKSIFFFGAASFLLLFAYGSCLLGYCIRKRGLYTFVSGLVFIISGLIMLIGLIMYISVFKAEVSGKLRPRSQLQPPTFTYTYGYSFLLYVTGFVSSQVAGICAIFLFINMMQYEYHTQHLEDLRRGKLRPASNINYVPLDHSTTYYPCRRHPQSYVNTNSIHMPTNFPSPAHQRRYFFSKEPIPESPCSLHRTRAELAKDTSFYDFPPPPTISYQFDERMHYPRTDTMRSFPRDITTHTVSTTADVIDEFPGDHQQFDDFSPSTHHEHEFVTFDLDQPLPLRTTQSTLSINSRNGRKEYAGETLRRTTPV